MKKLYIIAGPNGAGKTTASFTILPEIFDCKEFVNADEIARGLSPFNPDLVAFQAGRIMLARINELLEDGKTFALETTLSTNSYVSFIKKAKLKRYEVILLFLKLNSEELAIERVKTRVLEGGHNIPVDVIRRRYKNGLRNLFQKYILIVDKWIIADNSEERFKFIAEGADDKLFIKDDIVWNELKEKYNGN
ncbi:zeta toxin family protein [Changchengzhania lutea]|uniref:zeta toxin family protein n=1 Tax=Changchengzhania lutea TaxID=2049305 RepID=UPI00115DE4C1